MEAAKAQTEAVTTELAKTRAVLDAVLANAKTAGEENARALLALRTKMDAAAAEQLLVATQEITKLGGILAAYKKELDAETGRGNRLKTQADVYATAMTTIQKAATDAIATRVIDQADKG